MVLYGEIMIDIDCGDNSCLFATKKGGMRTNGGCRCFENAGFRRSQIESARLMLPELLRLREHNKELQDSVEALVETLAKLADTLPSPKKAKL